MTPMIRAEFRILPLADLKPHEEVDPDRVRDLAERIEAEGHVYQPVVADRKTLVVIDGHHRLAALAKLGAVRVPVHLVDYDSPEIEVAAWRPNERAPTKADVIAHALAGKKYPIKTTRHPTIYGLRDVKTEYGDLL